MHPEQEQDAMAVLRAPEKEKESYINAGI